MKRICRYDCKLSCTAWTSWWSNSEIFGLTPRSDQIMQGVQYENLSNYVLFVSATCGCPSSPCWLQKGLVWRIKKYKIKYKTNSNTTHKYKIWTAGFRKYNRLALHLLCKLVLAFQNEHGVGSFCSFLKCVFAFILHFLIWGLYFLIFFVFCIIEVLGSYVFVFCIFEKLRSYLFCCYSVHVCNYFVF